MPRRGPRSWLPVLATGAIALPAVFSLGIFYPDDFPEHHVVLVIVAAMLAGNALHYALLFAASAVAGFRAENARDALWDGYVVWGCCELAYSALRWALSHLSALFAAGTATHGFGYYLATWHLGAGYWIIAEMLFGPLMGYAGFHIRRWRAHPVAAAFARGPLLFVSVTLIWMALIFNNYEVDASDPLPSRIVASLPLALGVAALVWLMCEWRTHRAAALSNAT